MRFQEVSLDRSLYIAMTGAKHNMLAQTVHANNMANINTTGFRADFEQARSMGVYYGDGHPTRAFSLTENPASNFASGAMMETGNDLDIAIQGDGFIAVRAPDGTEAYTRAGNLQIDQTGMLRTGNGLAVLGGDTPIVVPENEKIQIGSDGTVSVVGLGQGPEAMTEVGRIKLVNPDIKNLEKGDDGLFRQRDGLNADAVASVRLRNGVLETSNVNAIDEFTKIMALARQYEMQVKMMKTADENASTSTSLLRMS